jgi:hypothetical protein
MMATVTPFPSDYNAKPPRSKTRGSQEEITSTWGDYPRIEPGNYPAYCRSAEWYRDPHFKQWRCLIRFDVFGEGKLETPLATISLFANGGDGKRKGSLYRA